MPEVQAPSVAGLFYPADATTLQSMVDGLVEGAAAEPIRPKALIAPHAGYPYSGAIAGTAYAGVRHLAGKITRIVLIGPAHRYAFTGVAVPNAQAMATPLGTLAVDRDAIDQLLSIGSVRQLDRAFDGEHALEVHLPFIQRVFGDVRIVPLLVGFESTPEAVDSVLERLWGGPETLIVVSSDLSHFLTYDAAWQIDSATARTIERLGWSDLSAERACGHLPIAGLLRRGRALDLRVTTHDLRNSGDTAGGRDRVVGYGAFSLEYAASARLGEDHRESLRQAARQSLQHAIAYGDAPPVRVQDHPPALRAIRNSFVTLAVEGQLRGCIGSMVPTNPLVRDAVINTAKAACCDPRFPPITPDEAEAASITIAVLSHPRPIRFTTEEELIAGIRPDVEGMILVRGERQALFLPKVWQDLPIPLHYVRHLKAKAGIPPEYMGSDLRAFRFTTEVI